MFAPSVAASARDRREFPPFLDGKSLQGKPASEPAGPGPAANAPSARLRWLEAPKVPPVLLLLCRGLGRLAKVAPLAAQPRSLALASVPLAAANAGLSTLVPEPEARCSSP